VESPRPCDMTAFASAPELSAALDRLRNPPGEPDVPLRWVQTIARVIESCGGDPVATAPFVEAWRTCYVATLLLDHVQDGDPLRDAWVAQQPLAMQYHLAMSLYVDAQCRLAQLDPARIGAERICRLQRYWATMVAQMAAGQYLDLIGQRADHAAAMESSLDAYARIAAHKTGAIFALAFGGAAILTRDAADLVTTLEQIGMIYGMVLQYSDDLFDHDQQAQQPMPWTLLRALQAAHPAAPTDTVAPALAFWETIIAAYTPPFETLCAQTPPAVAACVRDLWQSTVADVGIAPPVTAS
jgi:hypothetical protein